jgi:hypothetical protein
MTESECMDYQGPKYETLPDNKSKSDGEAQSQLEGYALVDGLNIAFSRNGRKPRLGDLLSTVKILERRYKIVDVVMDASVRHMIDDRDMLEELVSEGRIVLCPAGVEADELIWQRALSVGSKGKKVTVVTNDMFPIRRGERERRSLSNLAVSIFPDGEIYLLSRRDVTPKGNNQKECQEGLVEMKKVSR